MSLKKALSPLCINELRFLQTIEADKNSDFKYFKKVPILVQELNIEGSTRAFKYINRNSILNKVKSQNKMKNLRQY